MDEKLRGLLTAAYVSVLGAMEHTRNLALIEEEDPKNPGVYHQKLLEKGALIADLSTVVVVLGAYVEEAYALPETEAPEAGKES